MNVGTLLVATAGGHIDELYELAAHDDENAGEQLWVTSKTPQTRSLLEHKEVAWVRPVGSRQVLEMLKSVPEAWSILRQRRPARVMSTGAAMAIPYLILARLLRIECVYAESATRLSGPSVAGRVAELLPGVRLQTQNHAWRRWRWEPIASVFDGYVAVQGQRQGMGYQSVLVTVGTERFPFPRALEALVADVPAAKDVLWQTGHTNVAISLPGHHRPWWSARELRDAAERSDVVVTHAGVGSVLMALRAGRLPILIPRRADLGEHVDDHQVELARQLQDHGLAMVAEPGAPLQPLFDRAAAYRVYHRGRSRQVAQ